MYQDFETSPAEPLDKVEQIYSDAKVWELDAIMEEKRNYHLYEKNRLL
jgi:hypothetical protein